eukprot:13929145-Alexandrium_andersonii.AAC.1
MTPPALAAPDMCPSFAGYDRLFRPVESLIRVRASSGEALRGAHLTPNTRHTRAHRGASALLSARSAPSPSKTP